MPKVFSIAIFNGVAVGRFYESQLCANVVYEVQNYLGHDLRD